MLLLLVYVYFTILCLFVEPLSFNFTTVECLGNCCDGDDQSRSCKWSNLYYQEGGGYFAVFDPNSEQPDESDTAVFLYTRNPRYRAAPANKTSVYTWKQPFSPKRLNASDFQSIVGSCRIKRKSGLHNHLVRMTAQNWGHAVLDELLPVYTVMLRHNEDYDANFTLVAAEEDGPHNHDHKTKPSLFRFESTMHTEKVLTTFSGNGFLWPISFDRGSWHCYERFITGVGQLGARSLMQQYQMNVRSADGSNVLKMFRNRFYTRSNLSVPLKRHSSMDLRNATTKLNSIIITNKRNLGNLDQHTAAINSLKGANISARKVDLARMSLHEQLQLFSQTDIYISGVGTALTGCFLLPDGAVVANLGDVDQGIVGYWDEYIAGSAEWLGAVYAPAHRRRNGIASNLVAELAGQAAELVRSNFNFSVDRIDYPVLGNLSPVGRAMARYFQKDKRAWLVMTGAAESSTETNIVKYCLGWAEKLVCTNSLYGISFSKKCSPLNTTSIEEITRQEAGFTGFCHER